MSDCAGPSGDCSQSHCCAQPEYTCFQKDTITHEAKCMRGCSKYGAGLEGWACNVRTSPSEFNQGSVHGGSIGLAFHRNADQGLDGVGRG